MKNVILMLVVSISFLFACGGGRHHKEGKEGKECEEVKVPETIETKFASLYPKADEVRWEKEKGEYEAEFEVDEKEMSASFDSTGNFLESEVEIELSELPASMTQFIKEELTEMEVGGASKIIDAKGVVTYELEIKKDLIFSADGKLVPCCGSCKNKCNEVPETIKKAFETTYKDAENVKWLKEDNACEAEFELKGVVMTANYDEFGNLFETETRINAKDLPAAINTYIKKNLSGAEIKEAAKITDAKGIVTYEAEVNGTDYIFDQKGIFIKTIDENTNAKEEKD
jgi:hypothetical protein